MCYADHVVNHHVLGNNAHFCAQPKQWLKGRVGAFAIQLGGPSIYFGRTVHKPYMDDDLTPVRIEMLQKGRALCLVTVILSLATFALLPAARA